MNAKCGPKGNRKVCQEQKSQTLSCSRKELSVHGVCTSLVAGDSGQLLLIFYGTFWNIRKGVRPLFHCKRLALMQFQIWIWTARREKEVGGKERKRGEDRDKDRGHLPYEEGRDGTS